MTYDPDQHHRRSVRLSGFDYAKAGVYFVTQCTADRACLFGNIVGAEMRLSERGRMVLEEWTKTTKMRRRVVLDQFVVMPNHIHGIVVLMEGRGTLPRAPAVERFGKPTSDSIPTIVRLFKAAATRRMNAHSRTPGAVVWQRNYYEHVIRDGNSLDRIRRYIGDNPARWGFDRENPQQFVRKRITRGNTSDRRGGEPGHGYVATCPSGEIKRQGT